MSNAFSIDLWIDDRPLQDFEEAVLQQRSVHTLRLVPLLNRSTLLDLAQTTQIMLVLRNPDSLVIPWTKFRADMQIDVPKSGHLSIPLSAQDTTLDPVVYSLALRLHWNQKVQEFTLPRRIRVDESIAL